MHCVRCVFAGSSGSDLRHVDRRHHQAGGAAVVCQLDGGGQAVRADRFVGRVQGKQHVQYSSEHIA